MITSMYVFWLISVLFLWIQAIRLGKGEASCGPPPTIEKTTISPIGIKEYPIGTTLKYSCDFGYLAHQALPTTKCVAGDEPDTAVWTKISLKCIPRSCGEPRFGNHAKIEGSVFSYPNSVTYVCDDGYILSGPSKRFCQTNGEWSGNEPSCFIITCNVPENLENGRVKYDSLEYGAQLSYECNKGFRPNETKERICGSDGKWSGSRPTCIEMQCNLPESPEHGSFDLPGGIPKVDSIVFFKCDDGKKLVGTLRAKCLASGDWTFPTPTCIEPCTVPAIPNGVIIKHTKYRYQSSQVIVGTEVEDEKGMYLKCDTNFEPYRRREKEISISCANGKWSVEPKCHEASCWSNPPSVQHAILKTKEFHHGEILTYACNTNYYKAEYGKVTCMQGTWFGKTPVCKDSRCYITTVKFPSIIPSQRGLYRSGAVLKPQCATGYTLSDRGKGEMRCHEGEWSGAIPPCIGATCTDPPLSPQNGKIESFSGLHGTSVKYTCNDYFVLKNPPDPITCELGKWMGKIPECKDTRCHLNDLSNKEGIDLSHSGPALSGDLAEIYCVKGYNLQYSRPRCSEGVWSQGNKFSPCQKSDCDVTVLQNGEFVYAETTRYWAFLKAKFVYETTYKSARIHSKQRSGSSLYVRCRSPYIFNGNDGTKHVSVTCDKGQWNPLPHCLKHGQHPPSVPDRQANSAVIPTGIPEEAKTTKEASINRQRTSQKVTEIPNLSTTFRSLDADNPKECSCIINSFDENLIAFTGNKRLASGDKVKYNDTVQFQCKIFGFHRLRGVSKLTCRNCSWHSSEFPSCISPSVGDPIIIVDSKDHDSFSFTQSGNLIIPSNVDVNITCHLNNLNEWTSLKGPQAELKLKNAYFTINKKEVFASYLEINNIQPSATGIYMCNKLNVNNTYQVGIIVGDAKCQNIEATDDLLVGYGLQEFHRVATFYCRNKNKVLVGPDKITCLSSGQWSADAPKCEVLDAKCQIIEATNDLHVGYGVQELHRVAIFSCRNKNKTLIGPDKITCLSSGQWSAEAPKCKRVIQCPEIKETEGLAVTYTNNRQSNSSAAFHCAEPYRRRGVAYVTCLANGEWTESSVNCALPTCIVDSVFEIIPLTVTVDLENVTGPLVPHGTSLDIICLGDNQHIIGDRIVTCTEYGRWFVGDIKCVFGCGGVVKSNNSTLEIQPIQDIYKFGDAALFSCPPGQELTSDVQRAICLQDGWSDAFPDCRDSKI